MVDKPDSNEEKIPIQTWRRLRDWLMGPESRAHLPWAVERGRVLDVMDALVPDQAYPRISRLHEWSDDKDAWLVEKVAELCHVHWANRLSSMFTAAGQVLDHGIARAYLIDGEVREELQRHIARTWDGMQEDEWKNLCRQEAKAIIAAVREVIHGEEDPGSVVGG